MEQKAETQVYYAGFWLRLLAFFIDLQLLSLILAPLLLMWYGTDPLLLLALGSRLSINFGSEILFIALGVMCLRLMQGTPGKRVLGMHVVDVRTGKTLSVGRATVRQLAYLLSFLPLGAGFVWMAFDAKKQSWHDKLAGSVVILDIRKGAS